jgi:hypothetical protein
MASVYVHGQSLRCCFTDDGYKVDIFCCDYDEFVDDQFGTEFDAHGA